MLVQHSTGHSSVDASANRDAPHHHRMLLTAPLSLRPSRHGQSSKLGWGAHPLLQAVLGTESTDSFLSAGGQHKKKKQLVIETRWQTTGDLYAH